MLKVIPLTLFHLLAHAFTVFGPPFVWNHSTCWAAALQTEDLNVAESPASALCSIRKLIIFDTIIPGEYFIFYLLFPNELLVKGASTAKTLMREICRATVMSQSGTWSSRVCLPLCMALTCYDHSPRSWPPSLWSALIDRGWSSGINKCGFHDVQDQVDPLLHRWLWLTPQVDSRPN